jgi:hypothetical protein
VHSSSQALSASAGCSVIGRTDLPRRYFLPSPMRLPTSV